MEILFLFAFVSGLVTIFAPCIWPLLPLRIIISSTATGKRYCMNSLALYFVSDKNQ